MKTAGFAASVHCLDPSPCLVSPVPSPAPQRHSSHTHTRPLRLHLTKGDDSASSDVPGTENHEKIGPSCPKEIGIVDCEGGDPRFPFDATSEIRESMVSKESGPNHKRKKRIKMRSQAQKQGVVGENALGCTEKDKTSTKANNREVEESKDEDFEDLLTVTMPAWRHRTKMDQNKHSNSSSVARAKKVKTSEDKDALSHRRRIRHLIEQSRLKSRFGQLLIGGARSLVSEEDLESGETLSDLHISPTYISEAWAGKDDGKPANAETNSMTHANKIDAIVKGLNISNPRLSHLQKQTQLQELENDSAMTNQKGCSRTATLQDKAVGGSPLLSSQLEGGRLSHTSQQHQRLSDMSQQYMDTLKMHAAPAVKITVPRLGYSKVHVISRSNSMHF